MVHGSWYWYSGEPGKRDRPGLLHGSWYGYYGWPGRLQRTRLDAWLLVLVWWLARDIGMFLAWCIAPGTVTSQSRREAGKGPAWCMAPGTNTVDSHSGKLSAWLQVPLWWPASHSGKLEETLLGAGLLVMVRWPGRMHASWYQYSGQPVSQGSWKGPTWVHGSWYQYGDLPASHLSVLGEYALISGLFQVPNRESHAKYSSKKLQH